MDPATRNQKDVARALARVAAAGLLASLAWHTLTLLGREPSIAVAYAFLAFAFLMFVPMGLLSNRLESATEVRRGLLPFAGAAPAWMQVIAGACAAYALVNFFLATGDFTGHVSNRDPEFGRVASGITMLVFGIEMVVLASAGALPRRCCESGHVLADGVRVCPRCGAPVAAAPPGPAGA